MEIQVGILTINKYLGGGFKYFFIFTPIIWGNDPIWLLLYFKWVETWTHQQVQLNTNIERQGV